MTRRAVFVDPAPERVTPAKLRAELVAAGVPLEPAKPHEPLDCYFSGDRFAVIILADTDQWDALTRQVVLAHVPDPLLTRRQRRKAKLEELLGSSDELLILLLAAHREDLELLQAIRSWNNQLRSQLMAAGIPLTVPQLPGRTWEQHRTEILNRAKAIIDAEPN